MANVHTIECAYGYCGIFGTIELRDALDCFHRTIIKRLTFGYVLPLF